MRQELGTLLIVITLMVMMFESFIAFMCDSNGLPILRMICFLALALFVNYHGTLNRREYEAKRRKIVQLRREAEKNAIIAEYEQFRKEMHG